jgi:hypothetical protein
MLPPEELPLAKDADAEVVICQRPSACESEACPCPYCLRVGPDDKRSVAEIVDAIGQFN